MRQLMIILAGAIVCACGGSFALAQSPIEPPPLPALPTANIAPPPISGEATPIPQENALAPRPGAERSAGCTPGHCVHRTVFAKRRCKRHLQEVFLGYPEEFERPPLGSALYAVNKQAVRNAEEASLALRAFDFEAGTARLNRRGRDKLAEIAAKLPTTFGPVVVERSRDDSLDEARRSTVLTALQSGSFPIPPERVVVGPPATPGLRGPEAELIYNNLLQNTSMAGPSIGSGVASSQPSAER